MLKNANYRLTSMTNLFKKSYIILHKIFTSRESFIKMLLFFHIFNKVGWTVAFAKNWTFESNLAFVNLAFANLAFVNLDFVNLVFANLAFVNLAFVNLAFVNLDFVNLL